MARKILIVDDSDVVLDWARKVLTDAGYEVVTRRESMGTGAAILRERPTLVLLDVQMPALAGSVIVDLLKKWRHGAKILLFSSLPALELQERAAQCGADGFIEKVHDPREFLARIEAHLPF